MEEIRAGSILNGRYQVQKELGQGGMGAVYLAQDLQHRRSVAIKVARLAGLEARDQFRREAAYLKKLHHHSLPRVWDYFSDTQRDFLVMEYIPGEDLETLVHRKGPQPEWLVLRWADELLDGLDYLHNQEPPLVHRDIKPGNLKLRQDETLVLVDFGIATEITPEVNLGAGVLAVTPGFSPPEQYSDKRSDARADIYSAGATIYFLLTGATPPSAIDRTNGRATLRTPTELLSSISSLSDLLVRQAMSLQREDRWHTATAMRHAAAYASQHLATHQAAGSLTAGQQPTRSADQSARAGTNATRAKPGVALLLVLVAIGLAAAGILALNSPRTRSIDGLATANSAQSAVSTDIAETQTSIQPSAPPTAATTGDVITDKTPTAQPEAVAENSPATSPHQLQATSTPIPTHTSAAVRMSPTSQPTQIATVTRVPAKTPAAVATATPRTLATTPAPTGRIYGGATLARPTNGSIFSGPAAEIVYQWDSVGELNEDEYYVLTTFFPHEGQTWQDVQWTKGTILSIPSYLFGVATLPGTLRWNVVVMRQTGINADGQRNGVEVGSRSTTWQFDWAPSESGGSSPTRPAPPTRVPTIH